MGLREDLIQEHQKKVDAEIARRRSSNQPFVDGVRSYIRGAIQSILGRDYTFQITYADDNYCVEDLQGQFVVGIQVEGLDLNAHGPVSQLQLFHGSTRIKTREDLARAVWDANQHAGPPINTSEETIPQQQPPGNRPMRID